MTHRDPIADGASRVDAVETRTYETLDGMRGVAAVCVMIWHIPGQTLVQSGYLAVDLFFILSGFVLAYRYDNRLTGATSARRFALMRLIRLYPLYALGSVIGATVGLILALNAPHPAHELLRLGLTCGAAALMLPLALPGWAVFPLNAPAWSLFYEVVVNVLYGATRRWLTNAVVATITGISAVGLILLIARYGHLHFSAVMPYFLLAFVRTTFGFFAGILLFRIMMARGLPRVKVPSALILVAVLGCLMIPREGWLAPSLTAAVVLILFPILVVLGVTNEPAAGGKLRHGMLWMGQLSFPLYAIHAPIYEAAQSLGAVSGISKMMSSLFGMAISFAGAALAMRLFDMPLRRWLSAKLLYPAKNLPRSN